MGVIVGVIITVTATTATLLHPKAVPVTVKLLVAVGKNGTLSITPLLQE
jgi:hypothetical protein